MEQKSSHSTHPKTRAQLASAVPKADWLLISQHLCATGGAALDIAGDEKIPDEFADWSFRTVARVAVQSSGVKKNNRRRILLIRHHQLMRMQVEDLRGP
ncbi:hypothetical protein [Bradyrhizobium sp. RDI18]|uniref:hypothetical protein n=1 Tax=Bradyrhizobium sp. RDI18 TaxID=3367400 RepID=UPI00371DC5D6